MEGTQKFYTVRGYQLLEHNKKLLTSSMEDYLEMIYRNSLEEGYIRINELADLLNVQAPSATKMVQKLAQLGLLDYKKYGIIFLTENGKEIGKYLYERHAIIENFLQHIGVKESLLFETELIEHNITANTLHKLSMLNKFFDANPDVIQNFKKFEDSFKADAE